MLIFVMILKKEFMRRSLAGCRECQSAGLIAMFSGYLKSYQINSGKIIKVKENR